MRENNRINSLCSEERQHIDNFWGNISAYDIQKDAHKHRDERRRALNKQYLMQQNNARRDVESLSRRELASQPDYSCNHGLVEDLSFSGTVATEDLDRVKKLKSYLKEQTAHLAKRVNIERENDKALQMQTVRKGLLELEEE